MIHDQLGAFLALQHRRRAELGVSDCTLTAADWVLMARGVDPAAGLRGRYHDADGARAIVRAHGGLLGLVREMVEAVGLTETFSPEEGAVGVLDLSARMIRALPVVGGCVGIRRGGAWAVKSAMGVAYLDVPHIVAWAI